MRKSNVLFSLFAFASISSATNDVKYNELRKPKGSAKDNAEKAIKQEKYLQEKLNKAKGLKEFFYGENSLWASNKKVADKKAKKNGWV